MTDLHTRERSVFLLANGSEKLLYYRDVAEPWNLILGALLHSHPSVEKLSGGKLIQGEIAGGSKHLLPSP